jgi:hypothetical protein
MYLDLFEVIDSDLVYTGMNQYFIHKDGADFVVDVQTLDEYGEAHEGPRFIASSFSAAIAQIEAIENGEEM